MLMCVSAAFQSIGFFLTSVPQSSMTRTQPRSSAHRNLDAFTPSSGSGARALSNRLSPRFRRSQPNSDEPTELQPRLM